MTHDIWNPWHGCTKKSEGCLNCYMYYLDKQRNKIDSNNIYKVKNNFNYPLQKDKNGLYKIKSGEEIRVCMTSDFFLEEADKWRDDAWNIIRQRSDVIFYILTKRPERVLEHLPKDWNDGWENIFFNVTCENQMRTDERMPILLDLPFKHKGVMVAPFIDKVSLKKYFKRNKQIERVAAGGENYDGSRPLKYEWVKDLYEECKEEDVTFCFFETGTYFIKDNKTYYIPSKRKQSILAYRSKLQYLGKPINFRLETQADLFNNDNIYKKHFRKRCDVCGSKIICNGCSGCGKCGAVD